MYNIVVDDYELEWFFDNIINPPLIDETYMVCLSARNKMLGEDERKEYQLGRGEMMRTEIIRRKGGDWNFNLYKQAIYKYNCDENAMLTKNGLPYPSKCLVAYAYVNPSDECDCVEDTIEFYGKIRKELMDSYKKGSVDGIKDHLEKLPKIFEHLRSCHATNISRRVWRDFDCDIKNIGNDVIENLEYKQLVLTTLKDKLDKYYGNGNYAIIDTHGGYHCLVKVDAIKSNPMDFITEVMNHRIYAYTIGSYITELKFCDPKSMFIPIPGTLQYGEKIVRVVNKQDF